MSAEQIVPGLKEAIEARMAELGLTPTKFARAAGLTLPGLAPIRRGARRNYQDKLKLGVCRALHWTPDSVDRLLRGEPPEELPAEVVDDRFSQLEERLERT